MKIFKSILIPIGLLTANLARAGFVSGSLVPCGTKTTSACTLCDLWKLASNIINFISFNLAIPIATLLFVIAGVFFLISGGDQDKIARGRTIFTNTVIGLVIIFCSWLVIDTIFKTLAAGDFVGAWSNIPLCQ